MRRLQKALVRNAGKNNGDALAQNVLLLVGICVRVYELYPRAVQTNAQILWLSIRKSIIPKDRQLG